jgi:hypothetical protein
VHLTPEEYAAQRTAQETQRRETLRDITTKRDTIFVSQLPQETTLRTRGILQQREERDYALKIADSKANEDLDGFRMSW